ncbi:diguanylate cyclase [Pontibacterium granulatum]|uniref:sensor domain-containing diguanylate cyclase n=1 Tax=Pontibacterium granulatum TaxID=2036029 RepID=UPI00249CAD4B|nr:diguanylate cyclase [Pontibacterium granulatum]MDI3325769.1 diguanylate cyclase [Pontibacterium granulatum]
MSAKNLTQLPALEALFDHLADAVYLIDPVTSNIVWGNTQAWKSLGMSKEDILHHSVLSLQKDVHGAPHWEVIAHEIFKSDCFRFLGRHLHKNGHEVEVEVNTTHFSWDGHPYFLSVARDITNRVLQQPQTTTDNAAEMFALKEASDGTWDWNIKEGTVNFSPQMKRLLGYGPDEMPGVLDTWKDNVHPEDAPLVMANLQAHLNGQRARYDATYRLKNRNGHYIWVQDRGRICERDEQGVPVRAVGMVNDITDQKHTEQNLQKLASYDPLTNLLNRREGMTQLQAQMNMAQRQDTPLGIAFLDVDHFKKINDIHGHQVGDHTLKKLGKVLKKTVRTSDVICRWGGEEFLLFANNSTLNDMITLGEKIRTEIQKAFISDICPITISVGITVASGQENISEVLVRADSAMYRAKENGRNRVEYTRPDVLPSSVELNCGATQD